MSQADSTSRAFTRYHLADSVHCETGLPRSETDRIVQRLLSHIVDSLTSGEDVKLLSFGVFRVRRKRQRQGRDMRTGKPVVISARRVVTFHPSPQLLSKINGETPPDIDD